MTNTPETSDSPQTPDTAAHLGAPASGSAPRVTAVVVTYQSAATVDLSMDYLRRCKEAGVMDCVVVDNASTDGTPQRLQAYAAWAELVCSPFNNGFGRGSNIGLARVRTEYTLFLNPDAVMAPAEVAKLVAFMDAHPDAGICGPSTLVGPTQEEATYQIVGRRITPLDVIRTNIPLLGPKDLYNEVRPGMPEFETGWICGAVLLVRTAHVRSLGGFDPRFFLYWEEVDLCKRIEDSGQGVWMVPDALAWHMGGVSSAQVEGRINGCIPSHFYQSRYYYFVKHHGRCAAVLAELVEWLGLSLQTWADRLRGRGAARIAPRRQTPLFSMPPTRWPGQGGADQPA